MRKKVTLARMTSEHSKRVQAERVYKKTNTKKIIADKKKRLKEFESWWK